MKPTILLAALLTAVTAAAVAQAGPSAQALVVQLHRAHPELSEIGIDLQTAQGCRTVASTDPGDRNEACESDDIAPMRTGKTSVTREGKELDIAMPLYDAKGQLVGAIGIELTPKPGQTQAQVVSHVHAIVARLERRIHSKAQLLR
jgi:hypothetical protein